METQVQDTVEITIPRERDFSIIAELVIGGIAARHDVTLEVLDDLQLALASLLEHDEADDGEVTVLLRVGDETIDVAVGPVGEHTAAVLRRRRRRDARPPQAARHDRRRCEREPARRRRLGRLCARASSRGSRSR